MDANSSKDINNNHTTSIVLVPVYTRFGYGHIDLAKYEKMLEDTGSDASKLVQINFD